MNWDLSNKQRLLAEYFLRRIGFDIGLFTSQYIKEFYRFSHFDDYNDDAVFLNIVIQVLQQEINLRENLTKYLKPVIRNAITASEIENFTFCPVAFSIAATFDIPRNQSSTIGSDFHEKEILNPSFRKLGHQYGLAPYTGIVPEWDQTKLEYFFRDNDAGLLNDIQNSEIMFSDATSPRDQIFRSKKGAYKGRPDYIFKNKNTGRAYIVEEKFSLLTSARVSDKIQFYRNHVNQVRSYIYGISDFDISYGYLVYWKYRYYNQKPSVTNAYCKLIEKSDTAKNELETVYQAIQSVIKTGHGIFEEVYRHPRKCANCGASLLCGHKTGKFKEFTFPYSLNQISLCDAEFPELLVKTSKRETIIIQGKVHSLKEKIFKVHCRHFVSSLNKEEIELNYSKYNAEWVVSDGKLYLDRFVFYTEKIIEGRREVLWQYAREGEDKHFMSFISGEVECYIEKDTDKPEVTEDFKTLHLKIKNGIVSIC